MDKTVPRALRDEEPAWKVHEVDVEVAAVWRSVSVTPTVAVSVMVIVCVSAVTVVVSVKRMVSIEAVSVPVAVNSSVAWTLWTEVTVTLTTALEHCQHMKHGVKRHGKVLQIIARHRGDELCRAVSEAILVRRPNDWRGKHRLACLS